MLRLALLLMLVLPAQIVRAQYTDLTYESHLLRPEEMINRAGYQPTVYKSIRIPNAHKIFVSGRYSANPSAFDLATQTSAIIALSEEGLIDTMWFWPTAEPVFEPHRMSTFSYSDQGSLQEVRQYEARALNISTNQDSNALLLICRTLLGYENGSPGFQNSQQSFDGKSDTIEIFEVLDRNKDTLEIHATRFNENRPHESWTKRIILDAEGRAKFITSRFNSESQLNIDSIVAWYSGNSAFMQHFTMPYSSQYNSENNAAFTYQFKANKSGRIVRQRVKKFRLKVGDRYFYSWKTIALTRYRTFSITWCTVHPGIFRRWTGRPASLTRMRFDATGRMVLNQTFRNGRLNARTEYRYE